MSMQSAVAEHASNEMYDIDWEKAEIIYCHLTITKDVPWMQAHEDRAPHNEPRLSPLPSSTTH